MTFELKTPPELWKDFLTAKESAEVKRLERKRHSSLEAQALFARIRARANQRLQRDRAKQ